MRTSFTSMAWGDTSSLGLGWQVIFWNGWRERGIIPCLLSWTWPGSQGCAGKTATSSHRRKPVPKLNYCKTSSTQHLAKASIRLARSNPMDPGPGLRRSGQAAQGDRRFVSPAEAVLIRLGSTLARYTDAFNPHPLSHDRKPLPTRTHF